MEVRLKVTTRKQAERIILRWIVAIGVIGFVVDIVASYLGRDWATLARGISIVTVAVGLTRSETHKAKREALKRHE